jgi:putative Ca2+/H+ antiporter (TMEM165/GDT1 family)
MDWSALFSALGLVFVAELGDKTQLAVVTQTCKYRQPWAVFFGASLALTLTTLIGAVVGQVLGRLIPAAVIRFAAALAFVIMGLLMLREAHAMENQGLLECAVDEQGASGRARRWNWKAFTSTLGLLFVAELGDKTQLSVLSLAGQASSPWLVFAGGALALTLVSGLGVVGGQGLCRLLPEKLLLRIAAFAFLVMGVLIGADAL